MDLVVGVADMKVTDDPDSVLVTYSLGSCLAVCIYDPQVKVAGMLHMMLPDSKIDAHKAQNNPFMFADTGVPLLFKSAYKLGAVKSRLDVKLIGASQIMDSAGVFNIGKRNYLATRKLLWKNNVLISKEDVGGTIHRTVRLSAADGQCHLRASGRQEKIL